MTGREWQPGDVAMITVPRSTAPGESVSATGNAEVPVLHNRGGWIALADPDYFWSAGYSFHATPPRPLVVIDPEEDGKLLVEMTQRVGSALGMFPGTDLSPIRRAIHDVLREFANPTPPKPAEPLGLGAVIRDENGETWVRCNVQNGLPWRFLHYTRQYADIDGVTVLSEGVTP